MLHRAFAGLVLVLATVAAYWSAVSADGRVRWAALTGFGCVILQVGLGIANVVWLLPVGLREAHAANAGLTFLAFVAAFVFATLDGTLPAPHPARRSPTVTAKSTVTGRL